MGHRRGRSPPEVRHGGGLTIVLSLFHKQVCSLSTLSLDMVVPNHLRRIRRNIIRLPNSPCSSESVSTETATVCVKPAGSKLLAGATGNVEWVGNKHPSTPGFGVIIEPKDSE
jgi:hypothetical protein